MASQWAELKLVTAVINPCVSATRHHLPVRWPVRGRRHDQPGCHQQVQGQEPLGRHLLLRPRPAGLRSGCLEGEEGEHGCRPD